MNQEQWDELKRLHLEWNNERTKVTRRDSGRTMKLRIQFAGKLADAFPAILAEREAAQKFQKEVLRIAGLTSDLPTKEVLLFALATFDKESKND